MPRLVHDPVRIAARVTHREAMRAGMRLQPRERGRGLERFLGGRLAGRAHFGDVEIEDLEGNTELVQQLASPRALRGEKQAVLHAKATLRREGAERRTIARLLRACRRGLATARFRPRVLMEQLFGLQALQGHGEAPAGFILTIALWLWFTVLFANFAEALAEPVPAEVGEQLVAGDADLDNDLAQWVDPEGACPRIAILGPVDVRPHGALTKRKLSALRAEAAVHLAVHSAGVTPERLASDLWPTEPSIPGSRLRQMVYDLRKQFGINPRTGAEYLPRSEDAGGLYRLNDVLIDGELFRRLRLAGQPPRGSAAAGAGLVAGTRSSPRSAVQRCSPRGMCVAGRSADR